MRTGERVADAERAAAETFAAGGGPPMRSVPFPDVPTGWFYLCRSRDLAPGPVRAELGGAAAYVGFRDPAGRAVTLDARCSHMRADLARGEVVGGHLRCPLHAWEYAGDGRCVRIPAAEK